MTTLTKKIAIMQSFNAGKRIECRENLDDKEEDCKEEDWFVIHQPLWDWCHMDYRISPNQPKPKTKLYAYLTKHSTNSKYLAYFTNPTLLEPIYQRVPSEDKEIEL